MTAAPIIHATGLTKTYPDGERGRRTVLNAVDLQVAPGEWLAVTGRSGSGKSTLLHVLGGLDRDYAGEVQVAGQRLTGLPEKRLAAFRRHQVAFVFQSFHLVPGLTALQNVSLPGHFGDGTVDPQRARQCLERVGLGGHAQRTPEQLSGGERQRVAIARALYGQPVVLLCDEPTGNLDGATGAEVIALFKGLHREGLTLICVTHEERVSKAAARILELREGKLSAPA